MSLQTFRNRKYILQKTNDSCILLLYFPVGGALMLDLLNSIPGEVMMLIIILASVLWFYLVFRLATRSRKMKNYRSVCIGQTSKEVIRLLGRPNRKRQLKDGKVKYEWYHDTPVTRFKFAGRTIAKNESIHRYVSVTFANDHVIGVDAANMN